MMYNKHFIGMSILNNIYNKLAELLIKYWNINDKKINNKYLLNL